MGVSLEQARKAKDALARTLAGTRGLVGLGITKIGDDYAVKVNFSAQPDEPIPAALQGVPVQVAIVGKVRKLE